MFEAAKAARPSDAATHIQIPLRDGGVFRLADHLGEPVVLSFWASWCGPSRPELPALSDWAKQHPDVVVHTSGVHTARPVPPQGG